jgi:hypothetical protein
MFDNSELTIDFTEHSNSPPTFGIQNKVELVETALSSGDGTEEERWTIASDKSPAPRVGIAL